ncbi:MAG: MerR family transcriptional regulator [Kangiellaceae bacterium]|nr:MerR family transcriptional regulator [Kangiellaceae bacterium]
MKANEVVTLSGVSKDTLRYYEKIGLINQPPRSINGYRNYSQSVLEELKFVKLGQSLGFSLAELKEAIPHLANPKPGCPKLSAALSKQIDRVDTKIVELKKNRKTLEKWLENNLALAAKN